MYAARSPAAAARENAWTDGTSEALRLVAPSPMWRRDNTSTPPPSPQRAVDRLRSISTEVDRAVSHEELASFIHSELSPTLSSAFSNDVDANFTPTPTLARPIAGRASGSGKSRIPSLRCSAHVVHVLIP